MTWRFNLTWPGSNLNYKIKSTSESVEVLARLFHAQSRRVCVRVYNTISEMSGRALALSEKSLKKITF